MTLPPDPQPDNAAMFSDESREAAGALVRSHKQAGVEQAFRAPDDATSTPPERPPRGVAALWPWRRVIIIVLATAVVAWWLV